ncbi:Periplasmic serine protease [Nostoc flagelliforme CCNUN1]|uniref:Periplasmic serine protease n=1 Tax=Nostoc flagelliforme CCNUN1 TaxID=2038116 RepID=A0A2K8SZ48_9NOSO|nr:Periplasmic serine protease [Nostoc flagelliforme CCNUN1]
MTQAVQLRDGTVYFVQPPKLVDATTTYKDVNVWGATYYFKINVPENAGESLQKVTIAQREGAENIRYDLNDTRAFVGTSDAYGGLRLRKESRLTLGPVTAERETRTVTVNFNPPVTPGQTVTIALHPVKNPSFSGVYLLGVTAFPVGEKSHGQFLGFGRFQFYSNRSNWWFP